MRPRCGMRKSQQSVEKRPIHTAKKRFADIGIPVCVGGAGQAKCALVADRLFVMVGKAGDTVSRLRLHVEAAVAPAARRAVCLVLQICPAVLYIYIYIYIYMYMYV